MIRSFANRDTEAIWNGLEPASLPSDIHSRAYMKLDIINAASSFQDLQAPRSNRLHRLEGDREGQLSISINMKWRICFVWKDGDAYDVEIIDYH